MAEGADVPSAARAPLRTLARDVPAGLLVGDRAAGAGRHEGRGRPEGVDARADPGRSAEGGARGLGDARGAREGAGHGGRARPRPEQLPEGDPRDSPRRRQLPARRPPGRHGGLDSGAVERDLAARPRGAPEGRGERGCSGRPRRAGGPPPDEDRCGPVGPGGMAFRSRQEGRAARGAPRACAAAVGLVHGRAERVPDPEGPRGPPSRLPVGLLVGDGEGRGGRPAPAREPPEPPGERPPRGRGRSRRVPLVRRRSALPLDREGDRGARGPPPGDVRRRTGKAVDRGLAQEPRRPSLPRPEAGRGEEDRGVEGLVGPPDVRRHEEARIDPADGGVEGGPSAHSRLRDAPDVRHPSREGAGFLRRPRVGPEGLRRVRQRRRRDEPLRLRPRPRRQAGGRDGRRRGPRPLRCVGDARSPAPRSRSGASTGGRGTAGTR